MAQNMQKSVNKLINRIGDMEIFYFCSICAFFAYAIFSRLKLALNYLSRQIICQTDNLCAILQIFAV